MATSDPITKVLPHHQIASEINLRKIPMIWKYYLKLTENCELFKVGAGINPPPPKGGIGFVILDKFSFFLLYDNFSFQTFSFICRLNVERLFAGTAPLCHFPAVLRESPAEQVVDYNCKGLDTRCYNRTQYCAQLFQLVCHPAATCTVCQGLKVLPAGVHVSVARVIV